MYNYIHIISVGPHKSINIYGILNRIEVQKRKKLLGFFWLKYTLVIGSTHSERKCEKYK